MLFRSLSALFLEAVVVHVEMILAEVGGAMTHQIQDPLGLIQVLLGLTLAPIHLAAGTAVASMVAVRLIAGE